VLPISSEDKISGVLSVGDSFRDDQYLLFLTKQGYIKKTPVSAFAKVTSRGLIAITIEEGG